MVLLLTDAITTILGYVFGSVTVFAGAGNNVGARISADRVFTAFTIVNRTGSEWQTVPTVTSLGEIPLMTSAVNHTVDISAVRVVSARVVLSKWTRAIASINSCRNEKKKMKQKNTLDLLK